MTGHRRGAMLPASFFARDVLSVAKGLLGCVLVTTFGGRRTSGRIVEVEAYLGAEDPASHAWRYRRHTGNAAIYGPVGSWYVYRSYGIHWCTNLVAGPPGEGAAVLLRALEPLDGLGEMARRRRLTSPELLCAGPGRLCEALGITRGLDGMEMRRSEARIYSAGPGARPPTEATPRIGISRAAEWPLRFVLLGSTWASRRFRGGSQTARGGHPRPPR